MKCTCCRRWLKNPSASGMGPVCERRMGIAPRSANTNEPDPNQGELFQGESDVTIDEAVKARRELEDEILALLVKYRDASGLCPSGVVVETSQTETMAGVTALLTGVRVVVEV